MNEDSIKSEIKPGRFGHQILEISLFLSLGFYKILIPKHF
jgi:hypothetical protein